MHYTLQTERLLPRWPPEILKASKRNPETIRRKDGVLLVYDQEARKAVTACLKIAGWVTNKSLKANKYPSYEYRSRANLIFDGAEKSEATSRFFLQGTEEELNDLADVLNRYAEGQSIDLYY